MARVQGGDPPRPDATKPFCGANVWLHSLDIRAIRPQLGLAIPGSATLSVDHLSGWIVELVKPGR